MDSPGGSGEQVLALTAYIENGFQNKPKKRTVLFDFAATDDTTSHKGLRNRTNKKSAYQPKVQTIPQTEQKGIKETDKQAPTRINPFPEPP